MPGLKKTRLPNGKATKNQREEQTGVSVREWLAQKGILVGTKEWIEERRRQGLRFVIGKTPPAPDAPSPYKEARFNPTLMACTDYFEEEDSDTPLSARDSQDDGGTRMSAEPPTCKDDETGPPIQIHQSLPPDVRSNPSDTTAAAHHREKLLSHPFFLQSSDANADVDALATSNEDLPGLSSTLTRSLRLIIGKSRSGAVRQKRRLPTPMSKQMRLTKPTKQAWKDDSDHEGGQTKRRMVGLPVNRVRDDDAGMSVSAIQVHLNEEGEQGEQGFISGVPTISDGSQSPHRDDGHSTPVPPQEPVLVPTERYVPSKLDMTMVKDTQMQVGHTYWSFNAVTPRDTDHKQEHDHGLPSLSTPLYSNNDRHLSPQFSMEDGNPVGPSLTASVADVTSTAGPQPTPSVSDDAYLTSTLAAFTSLDEPWASLDMVPYSNIDNDMSPLQM